MGKLFNLLVILAGVLAILYAINYFSPVKILPLLTETPIFQEGSCSYLVNIKDNSLEPILKKGRTVVFNKCFDEKKDSLSAGTVVLVEDFRKSELAIVRKRTRVLDHTLYKVSDQVRPGVFDDVYAEEIKAIYEIE